MITVETALAQLGITRLAHFTPAKNLPSIIRDGMLRSSKDLAANAPEYFDPTDLERFDQHPEKLCCSFEFPNGYYLARARAKPQFTNYPDWVCLLLDVSLLKRTGALFSPCNASTASGAYTLPGGDALLTCYAPTTSHGPWKRQPNHHPQAPTDLQAEALVPAPVELSHLHGIVIPSQEAAVNEFGRLRWLRLDAKRLNWIVAPAFFDRERLSSCLRFGGAIEESVWIPGKSTGAGT